jgi:hypothetical protein
MPFILSEQRDRDAVRAFAEYREYVAREGHRFPPNALALASSDWYFGVHDHRAPHDSWLESVTIREPSRGQRREIRRTTIRVRLLNGWHSGHIEIVYPRVFAYRFDLGYARHGHGDWRYDEFRVTDRGRLLHEIEWAGGGTWFVEANDIVYRWHRLAATPAADPPIT